MENDAFPVVGIGASAGGLEAMSTLFDVLSTPQRMAFFIVQHLDPKGDSHLVELLSRHTSLQVRLAQNGREIEPDHAYVCVPNRDLVVGDGRMWLIDPEPERSQRRPIDRFLDSLAAEYGDRAVAIILSGTASDGSRGISAIKSGGGMVIAQDPVTAEFDGMPQSAINTGLVDLVLRIEDMPQALERLAARPLENLLAAAKEGAAIVEPATLQSILDILRDRFEYDFKDYKQPTLLRRTQRRMSLRCIDDVGAYAALVREDANEAALLFRDLMINVSSFFRDPEAWQEVERDIIDPLIAQRVDGDTIRVWSVGCASGEEAYTIGMVLLERIEASGKRIRAQIFATDVSDSLESARAGVYPQTIGVDLSAERLARFFVKHDSTYEVSKLLRDLVVFARHNVMTDPPFSRMDLICCRNMLIYIEPETQQKILGMFNFALHDGGALFLGSAETIGMRTEMFEPISGQWRTYRSRRVAHVGRFEFPRFAVTDLRRGHHASAKHDRSFMDEYQRIAQRALLDRYAPPSVVINGDYQVLVYHGDTSRYLAQPDGTPTRDLLALVSSGLRPPLRQAVKEALGGKQASCTTGGYIKNHEGRRPVSLTVRSIGSPLDASPLILVSFTEAAPREMATDREVEKAEGGSLSADQLEEELGLTRRDLQDVSEQYDRLVEEYGTANEEMLSINEELQSANEELETSKEELQSLNEELNTLNSELRNKVVAVEQTNNDLNNLLASTEVATLFLNRNCQVRWFTPAIQHVLHLIPSDVGRPISDLASIVSGSEIELAAREVLDKLVPIETEVDNGEGRYFIRRILPYRTADNKIDGIVVTFVNITAHKRGQQQRERLLHELSHRIKNTLATVQAIVYGLGRSCASVPELLAAFEPRMAALARAHALLTLPDNQRVELRHLLNRELLPFVGENSPRIIIEGDGVALSRESAIALEMVFHELVTNATKYGSLSNDTGLIVVRWECSHAADGARARIEWIESGGPLVESENSQGFGSLLIESSVTHDLAGAVSMRYEPHGLHCIIEFPLVYGAIDASEDEKTGSGVFIGNH